MDINAYAILKMTDRLSDSIENQDLSEFYNSLIQINDELLNNEVDDETYQEIFEDINDLINDCELEQPNKQNNQIPHELRNRASLLTTRIDGVFIRYLHRSDSLESTDQLKKENEILMNKYLKLHLETITDRLENMSEVVNEQSARREKHVRSIKEIRKQLEDIGDEGVRYEGMSDEVEEIIENRLDDDGFESFMQASKNLKDNLENED